MITSDAIPATAPVWNFHTFEREISSLYFPVETDTPDEDNFFGQVQNCKVGSIDIAQMRSAQLHHRRRAEHVREDREAYLLVPITSNTPISFRQGTTDLSICQNQFLIQLSDEPYEYLQMAPGTVWTVKIPRDEMAQFLPAPERYATHAFDTLGGMGRVFADLVQMAPRRCPEMGGHGEEDFSRVMLEVLALTLENDARVLGSNQKPVRQAMLARIERYIRENLSNPTLSVEQISGAMGISPRYLHKLFQDQDRSVSRWILEQRLAACDRDLRRSVAGETVAEIGFRWGFSDASHFSRVYRKQFGQTPRARQAEFRMN